MIKSDCAGIVLYNPDLNRLSENILAIYNQVDKIILVDNCSDNIEVVKSKYNLDKKIYIIENQVNMGIAKALNQIADKAYEWGFEWVLLLDQDSICGDRIMLEYKKYLNNDRLALLCPYIIDINKTSIEEYSKLNLPPTSRLLWAITSGSLININILKELGGFDEYLFIDGVDIEYSKRLHVYEYTQLRINNVYLLQEVGNAEKLKLKRFHKDMVGKWSLKPFYRTNHSQIRKYYMARNDIILAKKFKKIENYYINISKILIINLFRILIEKNKVKTIQSIYKGIIDGFSYNVNVLEVKKGRIE